MRRSDIRNYIAELLAPIATAYPSRGYAVIGADMPFIVVYIAREDSMTATMQPRTQHKGPRISIEYACEASPELIEDELDAAAEAIETLIYDDPTLNDQVMEIDLEVTEIDVQVKEGLSKPIGVVRLNFTGTYSVAAERE